MLSIIERIDQHYEKKNDEPPRSYLGASQIGAECERATWYSFRWAKKIFYSGRMLRLFERGQEEEKKLVQKLRDALSATIETIDPATDKQYRAEAFEKHFGGSMDGISKDLILDGPPYILEFKTHKDSSFNDLVKRKVKNSKPQHYAQMQVYMGLFKIPNAYYLAVNKNNDAMYEEYVTFEPDMFTALMNKAKRLILAENPPERINDNPSYYKCKMCPFYGICHNSEKLDINCRTCVHSTPDKDGKWKCNKLNIILEVKDQLQGCVKHDPIT